MTQVWDRLFIGGTSDALEVAKSNAFGIATVITLCREPVRIRRGGVNYLNFPVVETPPTPTRWVDPIIDALFENIRWGKVLVASNGTIVAPVIAAAWMHTVGFKDFDAALEEIGKLHTVALNPILLRSVRKAVR